MVKESIKLPSKEVEMISDIIDPNSIGGIADRVGVSFAISVALILLMVAIGRWLMKSVFDKLVSSHISMLEALKTTNEKNTESVQKLAKIEAVRLASDKKAQDELLINSRKVNDRLDQLILTINDQTERLEKSFLPEPRGKD